MKDRPMHDVEQGLPRRLASGGSRRPILLSWKVLLPIGVLLLAFALVPFGTKLRSPVAELTYTELVRAIDAGRVASINIEPGYGVRGRWRTSMHSNADFEVLYTVGDPAPLLQHAERAGVSVAFRRVGSSEAYRGWISSGALVLVVLSLLFILYYNVRHQFGGGSDVGKRTSGGTTSFRDVAGTQGAAEELHEIVEFLKSPAAFTAMGAHVPKGVLLIGPPGTGKTLLARAVAGEAGVPFFFLSGSEVTGFVVGLGAHRIRSLFKKARKRGGVIFIDELDALGGARGRNRSHNEDDRTLNQLLVEMDGFAPSDGVVVIAATNRPEDLDTALKRPGRFDRTVTVGLPTAEGRAAILQLHAARKRVPLGGDVDFNRLARLLPGSSGAELANLLNEAAIAAVRQHAPEVGWSHFEIARDRMLLGKERVGFSAPDQEWHIVAYHEAGHALAGVVACPEDGLHKVTIQPRGQAMGVAHFAPDTDRHLHSRRYMHAQIIKGLGGRVAEEIVFGAEHVTGGAESDLIHVNRVARRMIYRLGMGDDQALLVYDEAGGPLSGEAQAKMDQQVNTLLRRLYDDTRDILTRHRAALDALAAALLEHETIDGADALRILQENGVNT
ncbi:MAG TPA: AAA family ATPase [Longimicrobiales bacterium]|nr:AAA family ATPase [Longimicrobiales bacterium]